MPAYTTVLGLYKPGGGATGNITPDEVLDVDKLNGNADLIDAAVGFGSWTTVTRPLKPFLGMTGYNATLDIFERWSGSGWVSTMPTYLNPTTVKGYGTGRAFQRLYPTVTNGTTRSDGTGTVASGASAASPLILSGAVDFTKFLRYQLHWSANAFSAPATGVYIRGTFSGSPDSGAYYDYARTIGTGSSLTFGTTAAQAQGQVCSGNGETSSPSASGVIDIIKVAATGRLMMRFHSMRSNPNQMDSSGSIDYYPPSWTGFDGFALFAGSGTVTLNCDLYAH